MIAYLRRLRAEHGFTMPAVMGTMTVVIGLSLLALAVAGGDQAGARRDQDYKRAYSAAEAGINEYLFHLNEDAAYWAKCTGVPAPAQINQPWISGPDERRRRTIPGSDLEYAIELLPQPPATQCNPTDSLSMIDTKTGTIRIRSTGFANGTKRSLVATFRRIGFVDFLYYTNLETANPVSYRINTGGYAPVGGKVTVDYPDIQSWATANCNRPYQQRRNAVVSFKVKVGGIDVGPVTVRCTEINFVTGDDVDGPLHTNDQLLVCGRPSFGRSFNDKIEVVNPSGWRPNTNDCSGNNPTWRGERRFGAARLDPPRVALLRQIVEPDYQFAGHTEIELNGSSLTIDNEPRQPPPNGVIFVENDGGSCGFYDPINTELTDPACGDVEVKGTYDFDLTIAAERDIKITGDVQRATDSNAMLGLISQNFIRVDHPVTNLSASYSSSQDAFTWGCHNSSSVPVKRIDAAMLAIDHSFTVDNYFCGAELGTLTVNGAIAQNYRGTVGTTRPTGYTKDYNYDDRLKYRQPPHFLDPIQTGWRVIRQTEQAPAR